MALKLFSPSWLIILGAELGDALTITADFPRITLSIFCIFSLYHPNNVPWMIIGCSGFCLDSWYGLPLGSTFLQCLFLFLMIRWQNRFLIQHPWTWAWIGFCLYAILCTGLVSCFRYYQGANGVTLLLSWFDTNFLTGIISLLFFRFWPRKIFS